MKKSLMSKIGFEETEAENLWEGNQTKDCSLSRQANHPCATATATASSSPPVKGLQSSVGIAYPYNSPFIPSSVCLCRSFV